MISTYHNHTTFSDGIAGIDDLVARAAQLDVDELGISDHYVLHPTGRTPRWAMPPERLGEYVEAVLAHQHLAMPTVRLGLEVDWFDGQAEAIRESLRPYPFDYLIGSVHEVDGFRIDATKEEWDRLTQNEQNDKHRQYWLAIAAMAEANVFDIAAHIDLSKKFGHRPSVSVDEEINAALDAIAEAGMVVELNTAGWHKPCADGYPSLDLIRQCRQCGIQVTISSDAHEPDHLLRDFPRAAQRLAKAGYEHVARFAGRRVRFESLEEAVARF